jgi:geranylgeranyl diphosphate synthase type II
MNKINIAEFETAAKNHLESRKRELPQSANHLLAALEYSFFSGGKRFRPQIVLSTAPLFQLAQSQVIPWALAIEFIHTYSLIHDDLPSMDNDDLRRGQPTNHKVFGESTALLAGDALLTEAFYIIAKYYEKTPEIAAHLVFLLSQAAGLVGMVAGQVMDLSLKSNQDVNEQKLKQIHALKTGALIESAVSGVALIAKANETEKTKLQTYGKSLGIAFQIADDLLDFNPQKPEVSGYPTLVGVDKTKEILRQVTAEGLEALSPWGDSAQLLKELLEKNISRQQ